MVQNTVFSLNIRPLDEKEIEKFCMDIKNSQVIQADVSVFISVRKHYEIKRKGTPDGNFPSIRMISDREQAMILESFSFMHRRIISFLKRKLEENSRVMKGCSSEDAFHTQKLLSLYMFKELKLSIYGLKNGLPVDNPQFYLHFLIRELQLFSAIPSDERTKGEQDYIDGMNKEVGILLDYLYGRNRNMEKNARTDMNDPTLVFSYGNAQLNHYDIISSHRDLTVIEALHVNDIKTLFWSNIFRFAIKEYQKYSLGFMTFSDSRNEVKQAAAEKLFMKFRSYRYNLATPTTFLSNQVKEVTFDYLRNFSQNMTHYDSRNYDTIKKAIELFKRHNVNYDIVLLSNYTGLSYQVVRDTLQIASNSLQVNIDDIVNTADHKNKNPEDIETDKEMNRFFKQIILNTLSAKEMFVFLEKYDAPYKSFASISSSEEGVEILGKSASPQSVKLLYDTARLKLYRHPEIRKLAIEAGYLGTEIDAKTREPNCSGIRYVKKSQIPEWKIN